MSWADQITPPDGFKLHSFNTNAKGDVTSRRMVRSGKQPNDVTKIPDPSAISRTSTLYDRDGEVTAQWVIEKPEDRDRWIVLQTWADTIAEGLPARPIVSPPESPSNTDLMVAYPVGDHHTGMLAWEKETGENYDLDIAEEILTRAIEELVREAPPSGTAVVPFLGDFFHYDSFDQVTPTNRNLLDADGRAPKMISVGMRLMERCIETAAAKHAEVCVIVELGNHDRYTSMIAARWLDRIYRDNPRITVDINPGHFHYHHFGQNLLGFHHGTGRAAKPAQLPGIMAHDQRELWGQTRYHYWHTGHVHHEAVSWFPGCKIETHRILAPADAYTHNEGYRSARGMTAITYHREYGECGRNIVNPKMLESK